MTVYDGTATVNLERLYLNINDRYPYIEIAGPHCEVEVRSSTGADTSIEYAIKYYIDKNDESMLENTEITYLTRNVTNSIIKKLMEDQHRRGLAENTKVIDYGFAFELIGEDVEFIVYVIIQVQSLISITDPWVLA